MCVYMCVWVCVFESVSARVVYVFVHMWFDDDNDDLGALVAVWPHYCAI